MIVRVSSVVSAAVLVLVAFLAIVRDHPAAEHTRAFREEDKAARAVLAALRAPPSTTSTTTSTPPAWDDVMKLVGERKVWVTVHDHGGAARKTMALDEARAQVGAQVGAAGAAGALAEGAVLQVDVAIDAPAAVGIAGPLTLGIDPGLDGVTLPSGEVIPPGVLLARGLDRAELGRMIADEGARLGVRTYALVETAAGPKRLLLGALFPEPEVDPARLLHAASLGGIYLAAHVNDNRRFDYEIDASTGKPSTGYNAVRHAGTAYAMVQLYRQQIAHARSLMDGTSPPNAEVIEGANKAVAWLLEKTRDDPTDATRAFQVDGKKIKLGGGALTLMAFVERLQVESPPPAPAVEEKAAKLARYLISQQDEDGRFTSYYAPSEKYQADARDSIYYPGEAVLALARYAALDVKRGRAADAERWRAAAEKGARFLVDERHKALGVRVRMPVDAWLLLAIELLDRTGKYADDDALLVHADRITNQIIREQYLDEDVPLPMRGARADRDFGSLVSTGSRMEALAAASALEARHRPKEMRVRRAAIANAAYGMRFQFHEDRMFLTHPAAKALGGVPNSLDDPRVRIDGVQHNMSGWMLLAAVLAQRDVKDLP